MQNLVISIIQIILSILLITAILLQQRGSGLGSTFGGGGEIFRTKRGLEKILFYITIVLSVFFFATAILNVALS